MKFTEYPLYQMISLWNHQLIKEYDYFNWKFKLKLIRPQIKILEVTSFLGQWDPLLREIKISADLIQNYSWHIVLEILKHEMAHQIATDKGLAHTAHGPEFKAICQTLGVDPRFQKAQAEINFDEINFESSKGFEINSGVDPEGKRLMEKIEKLLSLAQSKNENEALAAMEKVNELYEKYNIDRVSKRTEGHQYAFLVINLQSSKTKAHFSLISSILIEHFFVDVVNSDIYDPFENQKIKTIEIFGVKENLLIAEYVFHFLKQTVDEMWHQHSKNHKLASKFKRSFQLGLLHGFNQKLRQSKNQRINSNQDLQFTKQLSLLENDSLLSNFIKSKYPNLVKIKRRSGRIYDSAYSKGLENGKKIIIHKGIEKSSDIKNSFFLKF